MCPSPSQLWRFVQEQCKQNLTYFKYEAKTKKCSAWRPHTKWMYWSGCSIWMLFFFSFLFFFTPPPPSTTFTEFRWVAHEGRLPYVCTLHCLSVTLADWAKIHGKKNWSFSVSCLTSWLGSYLRLIDRKQRALLESWHWHRIVIMPMLTLKAADYNVWEQMQYNTRRLFFERRFK